MPDFNFIKFENRNVRLENRITLTKSNSIGFPQKFYNDNLIKDYKYVILYWDKENMAIGIEFTNNEQETNKFSILHSKIGYGGSIGVRSFLKSNNIDPNIYHGRYTWEKVAINDNRSVFAIKLERAKN